MSLAWLAISMSPFSKKRSHIWISKISGPNMVPEVHRKEFQRKHCKRNLFWFFEGTETIQILVNEVQGICNTTICINLFINNSWSIQPRAFERPVKRDSVWPRPSTDLYHFSIISIKQCWALKPIRKPHWNFGYSLSKCRYIWVYISFSYTLRKVGRILVGHWFSLSVLTYFLITVLTSAYFKTVRKG